jgi:hypothetical protein
LPQASKSSLTTETHVGKWRHSGQPERMLHPMLVEN